MSRPFIVTVTAIFHNFAAAQTTVDTVRVPEDFSTIQEALDADCLDWPDCNQAFAQDLTILVGSGVYAETLLVYKNYNYTLKSLEGPASTVIDAEGLYYRPLTIFSYATIEGFTIQNGSNVPLGGGIFANGLILEGCTIQNCHSLDRGGGVFCRNLIASNCTFLENNSPSGSAIFCEEFEGTNCAFVSDMSVSDASGENQACVRGAEEIDLTGCSFVNDSPLAEPHLFYGLTDGYASDLFSSGNILDCTFEGENCTALHIDGGYVDVESSTFENLETGILVTDNNGTGLLDCDGCQFSNSGCGINASNMDDYYGEYCAFGTTDDCRIQVQDCEFTQNTGPNGSAISLPIFGTLVLADSSFCENNFPAITGGYLNSGGNTFYSTCESFTGTCCLDDQCSDLTSIECAELGGQFGGYTTSCASAGCPFPQSIGSCCVNGEAITLAESQCILIGGEFQGEGVDPEDAICLSACISDVTGDGSVDFSDLLNVINDWGACSG